MRRLFGCVATAAAVACGNTSASATFEGTVRGVAMSPKDAVSSPATVGFTSGAAPVAAIVISDAARLCATVSANLEPKSSRALLLFLADVNPSTGAIEAAAGTGRFPIFIVGSGVAPAHFAVASFAANDASCREIAADSAGAVSGSVTLTGNGGGAYEGTYDLAFDGGDHVTGAFHTATCQALATYLGSLTHGCG
ncbi:MAG: hypothetical protein ACXWLM_10735 [Myxococcales bacterium]